MKRYYKNEAGMLFCRQYGYVTCFDPKTKGWKPIAWNDEKWTEENMDPKKKKVTEITEEEAMQNLQIQILDHIDRKELQRFIRLLCRNHKINWHPMEKQSDGAYSMGYPVYPERLFDLYTFLGEAEDDHAQMKSWPKNLLPTDMNVLQIRTALTYLFRANRFCEDILAHAVEDGTLLKLMLRLEDLLHAHRGKEQHW